MDKILVSCCYTCKNYDGTKCNRLNIEPDVDRMQQIIKTELIDD